MLTDVVITSIEYGSQGDMPTEQISFNYGKIDWAYTPSDKMGKSGLPISTGWDLKLNKKA